MGKRPHHFTTLAPALMLLAAAPAFAVGHDGPPMSDGGMKAPREKPDWSPYGKPSRKEHESGIEDWDQARDRCERHHDKVCFRQILGTPTEPLRDDLKAVSRPRG